MFEEIEMERPWAPVLSQPFLFALNLQNFHVPLGGGIARNQYHLLDSNGNGDGSGGGGDNNNDGSAGGSGNAGGSGGGANECTNNISFCEPLFKVYKAMAVSCRSLRSKITRREIPSLPPSKVDSNPICLVWHLSL